MDKQKWYINKVEYYPAIKKKDNTKFVTNDWNLKEYYLER